MNRTGVMVSLLIIIRNRPSMSRMRREHQHDIVPLCGGYDSVHGGRRGHAITEGPLHRLDDMSREQSTRRDRVGESFRSDISSRNRENNSVEELDERFLCVLEKSSVDPPDVDPYTEPLDRPTFEHEPSEETMVDYTRELAFLPDLTKLTPTGWNIMEAMLHHQLMMRNSKRS